MKLLNYLFAIAMIILGIYITISSYLMGGSSTLFPKITGVSLLISSILLLIIISVEKQAVYESKIERAKVIRFIYTIILMIFYTVIIGFIGTFISTVILFIGMALILTEDLQAKPASTYVKLPIIALVIVGIIYSMFKFILNVPLPELL